MKKHDFTMVYRVYSGVSKVPVIYANDKFKMVELCAKSLAVSLSGFNPKIFFMLDNCPKTYEDLLIEQFHKFDCEFIHFNGIGNQATFIRQINLLLEQNYSERVMFVEDDYFFQPNCFRELFDFWDNHSDIDFISPYDHLEYYTSKLFDYSFEKRKNNKYEWRTSVGTTLTFLTTKKILLETEEVFKTYYMKNFDSSIWLTLTVNNLIEPKKLWSAFKQHRISFKIYAKQILFTPYQSFFGKRYKLWSPMPSLSTHMESTVLSPDIDWIAEFDKFVRTYLLK